VTSSHAAERTSAIAAMRARPELTLGDLNDRWLPVALDARNDDSSREIHDWIGALPGVEFVDVVSVNFDDSSLTPADSEPPPIESDICGLTESAGSRAAAPFSANND